MATVKFNIPAEFLAELEKDREHVDRRIVRVTNFHHSSKFSPTIHYLSVVATARVHPDIVRLDHYCGDLWGTHNLDKPALEKAEKTRRELEEGCSRLDLEIRDGVLTEEK